jgi:hypothetical protein
MPDPYSREGERRHSVISFCLAMTDEEVCELLQPFVAEKIERLEEIGKVSFWDAGYVEEANIRGKFMDWWNEWYAKQPPLPPFVLDEYLLSKGIDPAEKDIIELRFGDEFEKYRVMPNGRMKPM